MTVPQDSTGKKNTKTGKIIFILSICVLLFISFASLVDIYHFALVGALYEILWFPMIALIFILPVLSFIFWRKDKFRFRSVYPMVILIFMVIICLMLIRGWGNKEGNNHSIVMQHLYLGCLTAIITVVHKIFLKWRYPLMKPPVWNFYRWYMQSRCTTLLM